VGAVAGKERVISQVAHACEAMQPARRLRRAGCLRSHSHLVLAWNNNSFVSRQSKGDRALELLRQMEKERCLGQIVKPISK
jgi:hypothetical protein